MTIKPLAYAAVATDGSESIYVASLREQAEAACREYDWMLIPLYAGPQTWQDETAAVEAAFERSGVQPTWPADEAGNIGPMAAAMADEIARLRLTDEEREAIEWFAEVRKPLTRLTQSHNREKYKDTLRGLLERLK